MSRAYDYIQEAIDAAVSYGWNRAHKYVANPDEAAIKEAITSALQDELFTVIDGLIFQLATEKKLRILKGDDL